jgi:hypothetical protein
MKKHFCLLALAVTLGFAGVAGAQEAILDLLASKVIQKYQQANCEQLWLQKGQPKSPVEEEVIQKLRSNPPMREEFINKIAASIANKMFECGMIP